MKVGVLASGAGSNLQALLDHVHGREGIEIVAVAADKAAAPALARASEAGVSARVFASAEFADRMARDAAMGDWLGERGVELVVLAGYMQLLSEQFLARFPGQVINVHPALLPAFPGLRAIEQALEYGVKLTGATVHFVDGGVDTGPVILQRAIAVEPGDSVEQLRERMHRVEHELLPDAVRLLARGAVRLDPGNPRRVLVER